MNKNGNAMDGPSLLDLLNWLWVALLAAIGHIYRKFASQDKTVEGVKESVSEVEKRAIEHQTRLDGLEEQRKEDQARRDTERTEIRDSLKEISGKLDSLAAYVHEQPPNRSA